ncbi:hypothetical protein XENOCAPTIV_002608 [Xenoophorus captivus]|uniref:ORM1-like protein 1 n=1 Tax=Xenoophorus captivus TaxID=1517983 RepID=A0ABV0QG40_9TELE
MNVGVAHSEVNPNTRVMNGRGIWLTYLLLTVVLHIVLLSIPFLSVPLVWTLTNVIHNLVSVKATKTWTQTKNDRVRICFVSQIFHRCHDVLIGCLNLRQKSFVPALLQLL